MDEILKWLNRSKRKILIIKKLPFCSCRLFFPFYLHVLSSTYTEICTFKLQGSQWKTLCWQLRFLKPNKKDKLEWQVRDTKQLCRRKHMFGRGCTSASARLQQGPRQPSPEHNHRPTVEAAKIRPTFRPRDAVNDHGGRFLSLLVFVSVPVPLAPITACLWLSRASLLCLSLTLFCCCSFPVDNICLFPKHSHPVRRQFCLYFLVALLWVSKSLEQAARLSILPGTGRGIQLCVSNRFSPRCRGE